MNLSETFSATALDELMQSVEQNGFAIANSWLDEQTTELLKAEISKPRYAERNLYPPRCAVSVVSNAGRAGDLRRADK